MTGKPLNSYFLFIFFTIHLNPRTTNSLTINGEIATHPIATKIFSPIGYFTLFLLIPLRLEPQKREERGVVV